MLWLAFATLLAIASASFAVTDCETTYNQTIASTSVQDDLCSALAAMSACLTTALQADPTIAADVQAAMILAIGNNQTCSLGALDSFHPYIDVVGSGFEFHVGAGKDVSYYSYTRTSQSITDLTSTIAALQNNGSNIKNSTQAYATNISALAASTMTAAVNLYTAQMSNAVLSFDITTAAYTMSASSIQYDISTNLSSIVAYRLNTISLAEAEEGQLFTLEFNTTSSVSTNRVVLQSALNDDASDRATLTASNWFFVYNTSQFIQSSIYAFQATEDAVAIAQTANLAAAAVNSTNAITVLRNNAINAEIIRENSVAVISASGVATRPANLTGSLDSTNCTSAQEGTVYYSYAHAKWYFCNALVYSSFYPFGRNMGQLGGSILDLNQEQALIQATYTYQFALCYSLVRDGTFASTFHSKCDGKGGGLVVYLSSSGTIFGGYSEHGFNSNGNYMYSSLMWLYRFVGDTLQIANLNGYPNTNAYYNNPSTGPCFGSCDFWVSSDMRSASSCYSSYYTGIYSYSSTWLFQTGSTNLGTAVKAEIYTHLGY